jgi:hypothetical protein
MGCPFVVNILDEDPTVAGDGRAADAERDALLDRDRG